jgi:lipopolysaccharide/colanic/teichoic acid biosynthesis glycosyltransferase/glycosyltransferase involved in cell wall biosynthesis
MKIVVLSSLAYSLMNFRGALLERMRSHGHAVVAVAPDDDAQMRAWLTERNIGFRTIPMDRTGTNPIADLKTLRAIMALLRRERPDVVLAYTQKPIIYGGIACRLVDRRIRFHAMVTGLGHVYSPGGGWKRPLLRIPMSMLYRAAIARARTVFTFNRDDCAELYRARILKKGRAVVQVPGSGIDIAHFVQAPLPEAAPTFLLIARLMRDKGISEYVEAARMLKARYPTARFQLLGPLDSNPSGISADELSRWSAAGDIEYLGETRDVRPFLAACHVFVLPSYYREGLPRTILEAMAMGRAVITTDMPGCREPIEPGRNGFLIPPKDAGALAGAMAKFLDEPETIARMGRESRAMAVARYDVNIVNATLLSHMGLEASADAAPHQASRKALADHALLERPLAALAMISLFPVMFVVGLAVLVSMGRPLFFVQQRSGKNGRAFSLVKFRTMSAGTDAEGRPLPDDQRLGPAGRFLRRMRLDELPELWNVLRGDMALVGPRPLLPQSVEAMGEKGRARGAVRPGLTGWSQINGNTLLSNDQKLALDLWYIENRSIAMDLKIAMGTIMTLARGENVNQANLTRAHARVADWCS